MYKCIVRFTVRKKNVFRMASGSSSSSPQLPKVLVFDLDGCVWYPEMYELWGGGGAPFKPLSNGNLRDRGGTEVELLGDVRDIMYELKTSPKWAHTEVAVASRCDEPSWARECIDKFSIGGGFHLKDVFGKAQEIYKAAKSSQCKTVSKKTGVPLKDMIFFDNEYGNCKDVASVGVTVLYTPDGVTRAGFEEVLREFPAPGKIFGPKKRGYW